MQNLKKPTDYYNYFLIGGITVLVYLLVKKVTMKELSKPVIPLSIRSDSQGDGKFGASRGSRSHNGTDYLVAKGQRIFSPIEGQLIRLAYPYGDDLKYQGCVIENEKYEVKIFYMTPTLAVGSYVKAGDQIGVAQSISEKYSPNMKDHIHIEFRLKDGQLLDPNQVLQNL